MPLFAVWFFLSGFTFSSTKVFHCLQAGQFLRLPNIRNFTFVPVRGLASPVSELVKFRNSFNTEEEAINFYKPN